MDSIIPVDGTLMEGVTLGASLDNGRGFLCYSHESHITGSEWRENKI